MMSVTRQLLGPTPSAGEGPQGGATRSLIIGNGFLGGAPFGKGL